MAALEASVGSLRGWRGWWLAARPHTLSVAVAPVLVGTGLALAEGSARPLPAAAALVAAILIQIGTNLANDLFDHERGADGADRIGPPRAMQLGLFSARQMRRATFTAFAAAAGVGAYLIAVGGWPIAAVGALAIAAGVAYTGGPFPLGYHGLGDPAVFAFFGVVAVCGTYYVQTLELTSAVLAASLPVGALATAVLVVNNLRDIDGDRRAGKRTLAVRLGRRGARIEYGFLMLLPYATLPLFWRSGAAPFAVLLPALALPRAIALVASVSATDDPKRLNGALASTARLGLAFAALLAIGWQA